jgi:hypothetical protein
VRFGLRSSRWKALGAAVIATGSLSVVVPSPAAAEDITKFCQPLTEFGTFDRVVYERNTREWLSLFLGTNFIAWPQVRAVAFAFIDDRHGATRWEFGINNAVAQAFASHADTLPVHQQAADEVLRYVQQNRPRLTRARPERTLNFSTIVPEMGVNGPGLDLNFSDATTVAGFLAGGHHSGSDVWGEDKRWFTGTATLKSTWDPQDYLPTNVALTLKLRLRVLDTFDFCPGAPGGFFAQYLTIPLSRLEATGRATDQGMSLTSMMPDVVGDVTYIYRLEI